MHKIGDRVTLTVGKWECGLCGHSVKTLEKVATGDWRCIRCVGLTALDWITRNDQIPTAKTLYDEYVRPPFSFKEDNMIDNGCERCRRPFRVTETDEKGYPIHVRYCNDCVKQCQGKCKEWRTVDKFLPNKESAAYQEWQGRGLGLLTGRENFLDKCRQCQPFQEEPAKKTRAKKEPKVIVPEPSNSTLLDQLEAMLRGGQGA